MLCFVTESLIKVSNFNLLGQSRINEGYNKLLQIQINKIKLTKTNTEIVIVTKILQ